MYAAAPEKERIYFGAVKTENQDGESSAMEVETANVVAFDALPDQAPGQSSMIPDPQTQYLMQDINKQRAMRDIPVPTQDKIVKARLVELEVPMILFGEGKPERRQRLRELCHDRNVSPMPAAEQKQMELEEDAQTQALKTLGPQELKDVRIELVKSSMALAKARIERRTAEKAELSTNFKYHIKKWDDMQSRLSKFTEISSTVGDLRPLSQCEFSPDGTMLATSSWTGAVKVWNVKTSKATTTIRAHRQRAQTVSWNPKMESPAGLCLATGGADNNVKLWSLKNPEPLRELVGHQDRINRVVFHPTGKWLASTSYDRTWSLWDAETGVELMTQGGNSRAVYGLAFHPDGALVGTGGFDAVGRIWDVRSGRVVWNMRGHAKQILTIDWNPDGFHVATGSDDRTARIWDLRKKFTEYVIPAHTSVVSAVKFQPKYGRYLVTAGFDKTWKVWSTKDWSLLKTFSGHDSKITSVAFAPHLEGQGRGDAMDIDGQEAAGGTSTDPEGFDSDTYQLPVRFATTSFDKTWKLWEYDELSDL
eukprot:TRINITY_DN2054_c0_g1_i1.p1 TRINITY_DN2054_c0_g1~~TRINITY_DN2054_c0_g1_i1.p1  ORF type:complete len:567 (+),score=124.63 TRINITY_DN2054_c0_g1_i1:97-1701(+)